MQLIWLWAFKRSLNGKYVSAEIENFFYMKWWLTFKDFQATLMENTTHDLE